MPVLILYFGAMASLALDFKKILSKAFLLLLPAVSLLFAVTQLIPVPVALGHSNLLATTSNAFMVIVCMVVTCIMLVNGFGDFKDKNVERFYHVLLFLITGSIVGFLYSDNLFLIAMFVLATGIFISILKFIFPAIDKKMFNALIAIFTTGFISIIIGCLIINNTAPGTDNQNLFLSTIDSTAVPALALFFLYSGMLLVFAAFPVSLIVHFGLHLKSHVSVKVFNVLFMAVLYWKYMQIYYALNLSGPIFALVNFALGMGNIITGMSAIVREMAIRKERRIEVLVMSAYVIDFGIMLALYGVLGDVSGNPGYIALIGAWDPIEIAIMLQILVTLATRILFVFAVKNIVKIFQSDIIEDMEGLKASRPITLIGFIMGTTGSIYLGIFILDGVYPVASVLFLSSWMGLILFVVLFAVLIFTATWVAVSIAWIFGGKDLPVAVKNVQAASLKKENATLVILIGLNALLLFFVLVMPAMSFLNFMVPTA